MPHFSEWTFENARSAIEQAIADSVRADGFKANQKYAEEHDHWQDGEGWMGPVGPAATRDTVIAAIEPQFVPHDVIAEVLERCANALMQKEPDIEFVPLVITGDEPSDQQKQEAAELRRALSHWWDKVKLWEKARAALKRARWSTRGALRLWLPPGKLEKVRQADGEEDAVILRLPTNLKFADALDRIALDAPLPDAVIVVTDTDTQERAAIALFEEEVEADGTRKSVQRAELWYVHENGETVYRVLGDDGDDTKEIRLDMGRRLPVAEMQTDLLITEPVRRQQARLNFFESLLNRITETGGFPERYIANAQPAGLWSKSKPSDGTPVLETRAFDGETWYLHQVPRTLGSAVTTELRGLPLKTASGDQAVTTPTVTFKDPTDPEYVIRAARHAKRTVLESCKQGHVALEGTAEASGIAYQQARADFEADLMSVKPALESLLREILEGVTAAASFMSTDQREVLKRYRIAVNLYVESGPITPAEVEQNNRNVEAGTLSRETAMARNGVEDVQAELERIGNEPESVIALRRKQAEVVQLYHGEGMTWMRAAKLAGVDDTDLLKLYEEQDEMDEIRRIQEKDEKDEIEKALRDDPDADPESQRPAA